MTLWTIVLTARRKHGPDLRFSSLSPITQAGANKAQQRASFEVWPDCFRVVGYSEAINVPIMPEIRFSRSHGGCRRLRTMITMLRDLIRHKGHADAALLGALRKHEQAARDEQVLNLLHHILVANRFWLSLALGEAFSFEQESRRPETIEEISARYSDTESREREWISHASEADLERAVETPFMPGKTFSVAQGMMQVCLHSHAHRAQCAVRLRALGGTPPASDFITWLAEHAAPEAQS